MSVSPSFRAFALEQLGRSTHGIRARGMFGGVGIYAADVFFALIDDDILYFKVDDSTREEFERRGMGPFRPTGPDGEVLQYYEVPAEVLEDPDQLGRWAQAAIAVAERTKRGGSHRRRP
jgi:DNA transformation protein and related proteins